MDLIMIPAPTCITQPLLPGDQIETVSGRRRQAGAETWSSVTWSLSTFLEALSGIETVIDQQLHRHSESRLNRRLARSHQRSDLGLQAAHLHD